MIAQGRRNVRVRARFTVTPEGDRHVVATTFVDGRPTCWDAGPVTLALRNGDFLAIPLEVVFPFSGRP